MALVGRIARAHGIRGQIVVNPETDFPDERFRPGAQLFVQRGGEVDTLTVTSARFHGGRPIIGLSGVATASDAEALAGLELRVPADRLPALPRGTFYRHDLIGCRVETQKGEFVGVVQGVEGSVGASRLVLAGRDGGEVLIPLAAEICPVIDPAAKRIVVDPPPGLLEANR
jgi:16S rRNA processing protein RimM